MKLIGSKRISGIIIICLLWCATHLFAQVPKSIKLTHFSTEHGLSQTSVLSLAQDTTGYIWAGTYDGLNRFNAYQYKSYRTGNAANGNLRNDDIRKILVDDNNQLWLATYGGGLIHYNPVKDFFTPVHQPYNNGESELLIVESLLKDSNGILWLGNYQNTISLYSLAEKRFIPLPAALGKIRTVRAFLEDGEGNIWIGGADLSVWNPKNRSLLRVEYGFDDSSVGALAQDQQGNIWVGTNNGLYKFSQEGIPDTTSLVGNAVMSLLCDSNNNIWAGTTNGLSVINPKNNHITNVNNDDNGNLKGKQIMSLMEDRHGNIWIGTVESGMYMFDPSTLNFGNYSVGDTDQSISGNAVFSILEDRNENLLIGTYDGGVNFLPADGKHFIQIQSDNKNWAAVMTMKESFDGSIWIGTFNDGITIYDPSNKTQRPLTTNEGLSNNSVLSLLQAKDSSWWIGSGSTGLDHLKNNEEIIHYGGTAKGHNNIKRGSINALMQDSEGKIWIGTRGWGLNRLDPTTGFIDEYQMQSDSDHSLSDNTINCIYQDSEKRIWIGTEGGLNKYEPENNSFKSYTEDEGLSNNVIYGILEDQQGNLWLSTNKGINRFDPNTQTFTIYNEADGLGSSEYNFGAYHKGASGRFYFGGTQGVDYFYPDSIRYAQMSSTPVIDKFFYFNREIQTDSRLQTEENSSIVKQQSHDGNYSHSLHKQITYTDEIVLDYTDYIFGFEFSLLHYNQAYESEFAYRLSGYEPQWNYTDYRHRRATYTNIPAGHYTFEVKASDHTGNWQPPATIHIRILPPWWLTWWAKTSLAILVIAALVGFYLYRVSKLKKQQRLLEMEVQVRTAEIAMQKEEISAQADHLKVANDELEQMSRFKDSMTGMIAHDLKNPLGVIMGSAGNNDTVSLMARQMLVLVNNLLEVQKFESTEVNLNCAPHLLYSIINEARDQVRSLMAARNIGVEIETTKTAISVDVDRHYIVRVFINLFTNAIKYAPLNSKIHIGIQPEDYYATITVTDEGPGIDESKIDNIFDAYTQADPKKSGGVVSTGLGLTFCKLAVQAHGGEIDVQNSGNKGAQFNFTLPLAQSSGQISIGNDSVNKVAFTDEERMFISDKLPQLRSLKLYNAVVLDELLQEAEEQDFDNLKVWINKLIDAAYADNREQYDVLIKEVEKS